MTQLEKLKLILGNPTVSDGVLEFYLDNAKDIICEIRNANAVEIQYLNVQIKIAIEMYNKRGAEGQLSHSENGINRSYESADVSKSLIGQIIPIAKTPYSTVRVIV